MPLFESIINDLFPKNSTTKQNYDWLRPAFQRTCTEKHCKPIESQFNKLVETYEMSGFRQAIMLVGNPYTGKSLIVQALADAIATKHKLENQNIELGIFS